jgi:stage II sporulation protein D
VRRLALTTVLLALASAAVPAAALGAAGYEVSGGGFGHGVGMSQYGAHGYALAGWGHRRILSHYYRGTNLASAEDERVRVLLLASRAAPTTFSNAVRARGERLDPERSYTATASRRSKLVVREEGGRVGRFRAPLRIKGEGDRVRLGGEAMNGVSGGLYRGRLELRPGLSGGVTAVNDVALDDYVRGVIAEEMPASWHSEALRAQAVVARSYALATDAGGDIFDQYPDTRSQVYGGVAAEHDSTNRAVRQTAGRVVTHRGLVAKTFFFSTSGGHTEDVQNIFGGEPIPYLQGVEDRHDDISPYHSWRYTLARGAIEERLGELVRGRFRGVKVLARGASPRIMKARVRGSDGSTRVSGATLQSRLGTYDIPTEVRRDRGASAASADVPALGDLPRFATSVVPRPPKAERP